MTFAIIAFLVAFLLIGSGGLLIFYRDKIQERISTALYPRANKKTISSTIEENDTSSVVWLNSLKRSCREARPRFQMCSNGWSALDSVPIPPSRRSTAPR